jgi:hypothetical protein
MRITRVYTDEHGETHFANMDIALKDAGEIGHLSEPMKATSVIFRTTDPDYDYDWHVAPRRQLIVLLDVPIEMEVSDGSKRQFYAGDIFMVEDTTGKGHRTRHLEPRERRSLFITLE